MQTKHLCLRLRADPTHGGMIDNAPVEQRGHATPVQQKPVVCEVSSPRAIVVLGVVFCRHHDLGTVLGPNNGAAVLERRQVAS